MKSLFEFLFWVCAVGVCYTYVGYPLLIYFLSRYRGNPVRKGAVSEKCSVVISAYNESGTLPGKLRSLLTGSNAEFIAEIWVGSDGSDDGTESAVEALGDPRIRVVRFKKRRGKPSVINDLVPRCTSPFVVLTDARQEVGDGALAHLLSNFADEQVGAVSGELVFRDPATGSATSAGMDIYWRYEKFIRRAEGAFRSVPGATGALYALRRSAFEPITPDILLDDVAYPMRVVLNGYRCVFDEQALVFDTPSQSGKTEDIRKRRTIAGNIQLVTHYPDLLMPGKNPIWFEFISHKMSRLLSPFLLMALLATNTWLVFVGKSLNTEYGTLNTLYGFSLLAQALFYLLAVVGLRSAAHTRFTSAPAMFLRLNVTTLRAWGDALFGRYRVDWQRAKE